MPQSRHDTICAFLWGRALKFIANSLRPLFYVHYWLFPGQRFYIKNSSKGAGTRSSLRSQRISSSQRLIPRIVWQTNYTRSVSLPVKIALLCNSLHSIDYEYRLHTDNDQLKMVEQFFPGEICSLYKRLTIGAAKADLWRLLVLYQFGGVYIDMDAHLIWPLDRILKTTTPELFLRYKNHEATNYFIASRPQNPNIKQIIDEVARRIKTSASNNVYEITGPAVLEDVLKDLDHHWRLAQFTCLQGNFTNKFFQYIDKPHGRWQEEQENRPAVKELKEISY
jgi:mannosyltransferase OCH1-like enzyme